MIVACMHCSMCTVGIVLSTVSLTIACMIVYIATVVYDIL
jgi:hypothetical protein